MARHYYFAEPYPDELIGSVLFRTARHRGLARCSPVGRGQAAVSLVYSAYLAEIAQALNMPPRDLLDRHTPFPFMTAFLPEKQTTRLIRALQTGTVSSTCAVIQGATWGEVPRFCPLCVDDDLDGYGESYWHRCHNLPFVFRCPIHQLPLIEINSRYGIAIRSLPEECTGARVSTVVGEAVACWLERRSLECIATPARPALAALVASYRAAAATKHPLRASRDFCGRSLCVGLANFYGASLMKRYRVRFPLSERGWPSLLARGAAPAPTTTVKHLILQGYLMPGSI